MTTDPAEPAPSTRGERTPGSWFLDRRSPFRSVLAPTTLGLALLGLAGPGGWGHAASFLALGCALVWALFEGIWALLDRAAPDPAAEPPDA